MKILIPLCAALLMVPVVTKADPLPAPLTDADYLPVERAEAQLGRLLFYDPILSGNRTVSCATCHHPALGTGDGVSLSFGDGGIGMGLARLADPTNPPEKRIPRNAPALFNLGARAMTVLFHDGRLEARADFPGGLRTPMDADMVAGFASALSAQTMFPVLSRDEMAGSWRENDVARAVRQGVITGPDGAWDLLSRRVAGVPAYATAFQDIYPHIQTADDVAFTDISNAIAAFMAFEWRSDTAPFDAVLRGDLVLEGAAAVGLDLFYGAAQCSTCHAGPLLSDTQFHAMAAPQIGPGKAATFETHQRDVGRFRVTGDPADMFAFRTPSLRNVALTAPYGHAGGHRDLAGFVTDHAAPVAGLLRYDPAQAILPDARQADFAILQDKAEVTAITDAVRWKGQPLQPNDVAAIVAFLETLTDPISIKGRLGVPDTVPSGLPVEQVP